MGQSTAPLETDLNTCVVSYSSDIKDENAKRGSCGLYNLGNTCFMNSGLQCLLSTPALLHFMFRYHRDAGIPDNTLLGEFRRLLAKVWSGQFSVVYPREFKQILGLYHPQFQDFRQHDCQEFLALLLDSLHEQLNFKANPNKETEPSSSKQPIRFENNINNQAIGQSHSEQNSIDKSRNAVTCVSSLTFDNMKETKKPQVQSLSKMEEKPSTSQCKNLLFPFTVNQISEDSNHSTVSEQSSDSDQCSVMKNLKLRSSPVVSQSGECLSSKVMNDCETRDYGVSSSDDACIGREHGLFDDSKDGESEHQFKRVSSLQDMRVPVVAKCAVISKASSEFNLVNKASPYCDNEQGATPMDATDSEPSCSYVDSIDMSVRNCDSSGNTVELPVVLNNAMQNTPVPLLEDIYSKETKTLNTNVLASEYNQERVNTDSEKFAKQDNTDERSELLIDEEDIIQSVSDITTKADGYEHPKVKDVNIRADKKSKSPKGACGGSGPINDEKEECFALNNVKRMKFEGTEKNLQMQEICKLHKKALLCEALKVDKPADRTLAANTDQPMFKKDLSPSTDSDMESEGGDGDHEANMEVSDDEDDGPVMCGTRAETCFSTLEVTAAEESWHNYLSRNDSVMVDTFQGQFKSTVICAECNQLSVTFEPFMYLSVPIPHAMERQLCVTLISGNSEPTRYLLTMHKQDKISHVKQQLCALIGRNVGDLIIAEVLDWHISRILEDNTMLRYINDSSRKLYAFELEHSDADTSTDPLLTSNDDNNATPSNSQDSMTAQPDIFTNVDTFMPSQSLSFETGSDSCTILNRHNPYGSMAGANCDKFQQNDVFDPVTGTTSEGNVYYSEGNHSDLVLPSSGDLDVIGTGLWEWGQRGEAPEKRRGSLETEDGWPGADSTTIGQNGTNLAEDVAKAISIQNLAPDSGGLTHGQNGGEGEAGGLATGQTGGGDSGWKSCAICLEDLPEMELMVHTTCGGTFCSTCLEMSVQHYSESAYCCPVCSTPAVITEDFVPLLNAGSHKPKTRIVSVPISYRSESGVSGAATPALFAHPDLMNLPSNLPGHLVAAHVRERHPGLTDFRVLLTDGTGLKCSRCLYIEHCSGCEVPLDGEVILRPGDHLTVSVAAVSEGAVTNGQSVTDHCSMDNLRPSDPVTLLDCFSAFTQSEELDAHNPWYCPHCKQNQPARKTMTVWHYPDTLIIHLKRFVFHELSSTKVDNKVVFPLDNLDLNTFISGPNTKNLDYNLYSLVCHFGGAHSGHYTAYARHPVDGKWYYYNDETVTEMTPSDPEFSSTYVLFYQRADTARPLNIPEDLDLGFGSSDLDPVISSSVPTFELPAPEVILSDPSLTSTTCHTLEPSKGSCDLSVAKETNTRDESDGLSAEKIPVRAELAEADSSTYDFYA
ncbi:uncharacterized protein LOC128219583 [Mya arenaria]|uniref:uncharacterized protein LOC128219583 n=1 Tax=Mya arenaria TaxID=6604 RepID=UPI0022E60A16|nr:uncharacterized protein LOC128219583 [Mya arenaria]